MKRLAFETSTYACSVALDYDGELIQRFAVSPRRHGELILTWADELLTEAGVSRKNLDGICVSRGPGSFTSLRLGMSAAVAIAFALDLPITPVSSLQALALEAAYKHQRQCVLALLDARMGEIYSAAYRFDCQLLSCFDSGARITSLHSDSVEVLMDESLNTPEQILLPDQFVQKNGIVVGNALAAAELDLVEKNKLTKCALDADCWPSARAVVMLSNLYEGHSAELFEPVYLRDRVAEPPKLKTIS